MAVSNESALICAILNRRQASTVDLAPPAMAAAVAALCETITRDVNDAVYRSGFATSQAAYDEAQRALWLALEALERRLASSRFLLGDAITMADVYLFPTIARFDAVYVTLFRCSARRVLDFPSLHGWMRDMHLMAPGCLDVDAMRRSYYLQLFPLNPSLIVPAGPTAQQVGLGNHPGLRAQTGAPAFHLRA